MQVKPILKTIFFVALFAFVFSVLPPAPAYAQSCGGDCSVAICDYTDFCTDTVCYQVPVYCSQCGGSCENVTCPPGTYMSNNGCVQIGDTAGCECGARADGSCRSCGGGPEPCYSVISCPANAVDPNNYYDWGVEQRPACPLGNAQSFYRSCYDGGVDGEICNDFMRIYSCCPGNSTVACQVVDTGNNYNYYTSTANRNNCQDGYDTFISTYQTALVDQANVLTCDQYNDDASECLSGWYRINTYLWETTCHDYNNVCACASSCGAPSVPTLSSPADGAQLASTTVSLVWNAATFSDGCTGTYKIYIGTSNPPTGTPISVASTVTSVNFSGTRGTTYYWYVRADNEGVGADSEVRSFTILDNQITGQVFYDPNNTCGGAGWSSGGVSVSVDSGAGTAVSGTGTYSVTAAVGASHTLEVSIPAGYACSTGAGCNTCSRSGIGSPSANNNFYLTDSREAWWQTEGAGIYAGGASGVRSILPSSSVRLILAPVGGTDALLITNSGNVEVGGGEVSDAGWRAISRYRGKTMDYNYFAANMGVVRGQASDWGVGEITLGDYPAESDFGYMRPPAGTATITSPMVVTSPNQYIVFVDGDLEISADVTVEQGGFLAFVVNGSVTIDPAVTELQGLYVIDNSFVTESQYVEGVTNDTPLAIEGTIVAWGSINIARDLGTGNITVPAEQFSYRPDLLTNMPEKMKTFVMQWSEVVPGTYDN